MLAGGSIMFILAIARLFNIEVIIIPLMLFMIGTAMIFPNSYAGAMNPFAKLAGSATAILVGGQILGGFFVSLLIAFLPSYNQLYLAIVLIVCALSVIIVNNKLIQQKVNSK